MADLLECLNRRVPQLREMLANANIEKGDEAAVRDFFARLIEGVRDAEAEERIGQPRDRLLGIGPE